MNTPEKFRKDKSLDQLAEQINVAQFVSFTPQEKPLQAFSRVLGYQPNHIFNNVRNALEVLFELSADHLINIRSFLPDDHQSKEFIYGLTSVDDAYTALNRLSQQGFFTIANETIDIKDGGVSGVLMGNLIEFAPEDTPRCVEKPGAVSLPKSWGISMLKTIYGFTPDFTIPNNQRLEFSIHPKPQGWKHTHTLGWELESISDTNITANLVWPNRFSQFLGDKVFGLLIADLAGLPVPRSTVIHRRIAPFTFGKMTGTHETWIRTCPNIQIPGKFTTNRGWLDPFKLLEKEDPNGQVIPSILSQSGLHPEYSGALVMASDGSLIIEGKVGEGETFMTGKSFAQDLPINIQQDIRKIFKQAFRKLGPVRFEWVHDGCKAWIVQLHQGITKSIGNILVPGEAVSWYEFDISNGLEALRNFIDGLSPTTDGVLLKGNVGLSSHIADVIRKKGIPTKIL